MNKDQARKVAIDLMLESNTDTTRGQLLLLDRIATVLANETERAFRAGLKRGKALAAEIVADEVADAQFTEVDEDADEDDTASPYEGELPLASNPYPQV